MSEPIKILIVEADEALRAALKFSLELQGFVVEEFADAGDVLAAGAADDASCLVLEHRPGKAEGLALLQILRSRGIAAPAVVIASSPKRGILQEIAKAGAALVEKPLLRDGLPAAIRAAIGEVRERFEQ